MVLKNETLKNNTIEKKGKKTVDNAEKIEYKDWYTYAKIFNLNYTEIQQKRK